MKKKSSAFWKLWHDYNGLVKMRHFDYLLPAIKNVLCCYGFAHKIWAM